MNKAAQAGYVAMALRKAISCSADLESQPCSELHTVKRGEVAALSLGPPSPLIRRAPAASSAQPWEIRCQRGFARTLDGWAVTNLQDCPRAHAEGNGQCQESGSPSGAEHFTAKLDDAETDVCGATFGVRVPERPSGASGTFTMSKRDGEIKLRITPPYR
jgi:hypothetical protein